MKISPVKNISGLWIGDKGNQCCMPRPTTWYHSLQSSMISVTNVVCRGLRRDTIRYRAQRTLRILTYKRPISDVLRNWELLVSTIDSKTPFQLYDISLAQIGYEVPSLGFCHDDVSKGHLEGLGDGSINDSCVLNKVRWSSSNSVRERVLEFYYDEWKKN